MATNGLVTKLAQQSTPLQANNKDIFSDATNYISNTAQSTANSYTNAYNDISNGNISGGLQDYVNGTTNLYTGGTVPSLIPKNTPPSAPGTNPALAKLQQEQVAAANQFRSGLSGMKSSADQNLRNTANQNLNTNMRGLSTSNSGRGLLYGGINSGEKSQLRSQSETGLASAINSSNAGLENAANTLDQQAINTAAGVQQTQQQIQNDIYSQAQAQLAGQNAMTSGAMGTAIMYGLLA